MFVSLALRAQFAYVIVNTFKQIQTASYILLLKE